MLLRMQVFTIIYLHNWVILTWTSCAKLIIDGVGFPSVGSIVGVDNADVAKAAKAPVLLVCNLSAAGVLLLDVCLWEVGDT